MNDTSLTRINSVLEDLLNVYGELTPGAIETADIDGMAFAVKRAIDFVCELHDAAVSKVAK